MKTMDKFNFLPSGGFPLKQKAFELINQNAIEPLLQEIQDQSEVNATFLKRSSGNATAQQVQGFPFSIFISNGTAQGTILISKDEFVKTLATYYVLSAHPLLPSAARIERTTDLFYETEGFKTVVDFANAVSQNTTTPLMLLNLPSKQEDQLRNVGDLNLHGGTILRLTNTTKNILDNVRRMTTAQKTLFSSFLTTPQYLVSVEALGGCSSADYLANTTSPPWQNSVGLMVSSQNMHFKFLVKNFSTGTPANQSYVFCCADKPDVTLTFVSETISGADKEVIASVSFPFNHFTGISGVNIHGYIAVKEDGLYTIQTDSNKILIP
ncbi:MAG: hypothetical protein C4K58_06950 [Flavobacteriaceae bacterium]|nr:MAG: hypothetical protein C4K58_06950 [Flavobacteriaceae bacterium]